MRFKLSHEWHENRWMRRVWFKHPKTGEVVHFPAPIVSKHRWRPMFVQLCAKHRIDLLKGGNVAQRGFVEGLALLLARCDSLLPPAEAVSPASPLMISLGWDALKHAGRHITHGGMKLATFRRGVESTQSELNFVSTNIFRDNDDHYGLVRGLASWVPALNEAKLKKKITRDDVDAALAPEDVLAVGGSLRGPDESAERGAPAATKLPRPSYDVDYAITLDLSAMRSISNRAKGCATHCECDNGNSDDRSTRLHNWPELKGDEEWPAIKVLLAKHCKLLTKERRQSLGHRVPREYDWKKPAQCNTCGWTATEKEYKALLAELDMLVQGSKTNKQMKKRLDNLRKKHRVKHFKTEYMHEELLHAFDSIEFVLDMMHGMPLNIAKILFKYSFLDMLTESEQREQLAEFLHSIDCPFDCRLESESGWMRASTMQAFECGSEKSPGLGPNIVALCDLAYAVDRAAAAPEEPQEPQPPPPPPEPEPEPEPERATGRRGGDRDTVRRPSRRAPQHRPPQPTPAPQSAAQQEPEDNEPPLPPAQQPKDCDDDMWKTLRFRYGEHASVVHEIMKAWGYYHELSELLARPLQEDTKDAREERACEVAHAAIRFAHRFEGVCNGRHRSWYLHNFVYVVPRQIERYGALWPFSTAALESRGARIKRVKVSWRGYCDVPKQHRRERNQRVSIFKQTYRSSPTVQIMRMIAAAEDMYHDGRGRGAARFKQTGRLRKVKIEADHSSAASYETDAFTALSSFLADAHVQAGSNV